ncbi:hypothetical protein [Ruminococcus sp. YE282]|uniref:hypothetical protein n=1 Tax=Ruminococcus sp. YE282 TaxID=3158780 RepID=UPI00087EE8CE|nr:hypothetical protein SAMN02910441_00113 [Ruminococcus bromii]
MKRLNKIPNVILYEMNKKDPIGVLRNINGFECDYHFNSTSEIKFEIPKKIYNSETYQWIDNPRYDDIKPDMLLYLTDPTEQYKFNGSPILNDSEYSLKSKSDTTPRPLTNMRYNVNGGLNNFEVQEETLLFDLGLSKGYSWEWQHYFDSHNQYAEQKALTDSSQYEGYYGYKHLCCNSFIPVENGDIIAIRSGATGSPTFIYRGFFYDDNDSTTMRRNLLHSEDNSYVQPNPISRIGVNDLQTKKHRRAVEIIATNNGSITVTDIDGIPYNIGVAENIHSSGIKGTSNGNVFTANDPEDIVEGKKYYVGYNVDVSTNLSTGYMRFDCVDIKATKTSKQWTWHLMPENYVQIYSGLRNVTKFNVGEKTSYAIKQVWWVITNTEENNDGINKTKTVTAKSYEHILTQKTFSLSEGTMPLFFPNKIYNLITSSSWRRDVWENNGIKYESTAPQRCNRGVLNQILDYMPEWKIGYVDSEIKSNVPAATLCCKYRSLDEVNNEVVYSFLMNEVEKAYQCFFIFDSENMTINIISGNPTSIDKNGAPQKDGMVGSSSNIILTWSNAIKKTNIKATEDRAVTALRVHTADDQYGMGLINPTGNNILYNFSAYKSQMQYIADSDKNRTLWEAIQAWQSAYDSVKSDYQSAAQSYVGKLLEIIQNESSISESLAQYRSVADKINIGAESQGITNRYVDYPIYYSVINLDVTENWRKPHVADLYSASKNYYEALAKRDSNIDIKDSNYKTMRNSRYLLTMDYKTAVANEGYAILSPKEVLELQKFIVEGDWTNENAVFSENFSAGDIISTLKSVYAEAKVDHDNYISQQCYEFDVSSTNIMDLDGFEKNLDDLTLGRMVTLQLNNGDWQFPILMGYHIDHADDSNFSMTFDTNYSNKPLKKRFAKLFDAINQSSSSSNSYTYED